MGGISLINFSSKKLFAVIPSSCCAVLTLNELCLHMTRRRTERAMLAKIVWNWFAVCKIIWTAPVWSGNLICLAGENETHSRGRRYWLLLFKKKSVIFILEWTGAVSSELSFLNNCLSRSSTFQPSAILGEFRLAVCLERCSLTRWTYTQCEKLLWSACVYNLRQ